MQTPTTRAALHRALAGEYQAVCGQKATVNKDRDRRTSDQISACYLQVQMGLAGVAGIANRRDDFARLDPFTSVLGDTAGLEMRKEHDDLTIGVASQ